MAGGTSERVLGILTALAGFLIGGFFIFFTAGPALFSDGPDSERWMVVGIGSAILFVLGLVGGLVAPGSWKAVGIATAAPVVPIVLLMGLPLTFSSGAPAGMRLLGPVFLAGYFAATLFGAWLGARVRWKQRARRTSPAEQQGEI